MTWQVVFAERARRDLRNLDSATATRVIRAIDRYAETHHGDVKRLRGFDAEWRLRVGRWRVRFAFDTDTNTIRILRVLPRSRAYRE